MPIYEYVCRDCNVEFEALIRSDELPICESCGSGSLDKLLSVPAAHGGGTTEFPPCSEMPPQERPCGTGGCGLPDCG